MSKLFSIINFKYDVQLDTTSTTIALFANDDQKDKYDACIKLRSEYRSRLAVLLQKGETVYKTETEKYNEIFSEEFKNLAMTTQLSPAELSTMVDKKYAELDAVKSGRTLEENTELHNIELALMEKLPIAELKTIVVPGTINYNLILKAIESNIIKHL